MREEGEGEEVGGECCLKEMLLFRLITSSLTHLVTQETDSSPNTAQNFLNSVS